jgi:hypothetical protein
MHPCAHGHSESSDTHLLLDKRLSVHARICILEYYRLQYSVPLPRFSDCLVWPAKYYYGCPYACTTASGDLEIARSEEHQGRIDYYVLGWQSVCLV